MVWGLVGEDVLQGSYHGGRAYSPTNPSRSSSSRKLPQQCKPAAGLHLVTIVQWPLRRTRGVHVGCNWVLLSTWTEIGYLSLSLVFLLWSD